MSFTAELDPIQFEPATGFTPVDDSRTKMPTPLQVKVVAVEPLALLAPAGAERQLDES